MKRVTTEAEIRAQLDAHDELVKACVGDRLGFPEFLATYGEFPRDYVLDEQTASAEERARLGMFRRRITFHVRVSGVLSGLRSQGDSNTLNSDVGRFFPTVGLMRLRDMVAKYPGFEAEAGEQ